MALDAAGDFVIAWTSYGHDGVGNGYGPGVNGENGVFARRYYADGSQAGSAFQVNQTAAGNQQNAKVSMDAAGDFTIVWESNQNGNYDIYARGYSPAGESRIGGEMLINTTTSGDQRYPGVVLDATGDAVIVWSGQGQGGSQGIFYQRFAQSTDTSAPNVTGVFNVVTSGGNTTLQPLADRAQLASGPTQIAVFFDKPMSTMPGTPATP